ncbi:hypothetical protein KM043_017252 [Ampulex compressa]|nr:hypothetical protein KM043_017252 [Ampulex compressa]
MASPIADVRFAFTFPVEKFRGSAKSVRSRRKESGCLPKKRKEPSERLVSRAAHFRGRCLLPNFSADTRTLHFERTRDAVDKSDVITIIKDPLSPAAVVSASHPRGALQKDFFFLLSSRNQRKKGGPRHDDIRPKCENPRCGVINAPQAA